MADGFLLDRDSVAALSRLLRERGLGTKQTDRNVINTWPTCHPARVTEAITARDEDKPGEGKVKLLISDQMTGDASTQNIKLIAGDDTEEQTVYRVSKSTNQIAADTEGYVIQDRTGKLWWLESEPTKLVRFILEENLSPSGFAGASIVSGGPDNGESIEVVDWAGNIGKVGDRGLAWQDGGIYWVIEIKSSSDRNLVLFTLEEDIDSTSHLAGATIVSNGSDHGESIEVTDWAENGGRSGDNGVAWKTKDPVSGVDVYVIIEAKRPPQFITARISGSFEITDACPDGPYELTGVEGFDEEWEAEATTPQAHNPRKIKVWNEAKVLLIHNRVLNRYEIVSATSDQVVHGIEIFKELSAGGGGTCKLRELQFAGWQNWGDPNWVTEIMVTGTAPNRALRYKTYCTPAASAGMLVFEIGDGCP